MGSGSEEKKEETKQEDKTGKTRAQRTDEQDVRTGRGSAGFVRRGDERRRTDETSGTGKGKRNGGKGEHECRRGSGSKRAKQREEEEQVHVAPNMGAGGSDPRATL